MGRRKMTWEELKARGCKPSRWQKRQIEDTPPPPPVAAPVKTINPEAVAEYAASCLKEWNTFDARCVPGVFTRQHGSGYPWPEAGGKDYAEHGAKYTLDGTLLRCKQFAERQLAKPDCGSWTRELCERFLEVLEGKTEFVIDCEAAKNASRMLDIWGEDIPMLRWLAIVEFLCVKDRTGASRFPDEYLLQFNEQDIAMMDAAFTAQQQAFVATA